MATIRKRGRGWHVQVRRKGHPSITRTFLLRKDAETWARQTEAEADRGILPDIRKLEGITLAEIVTRYRDEVSVRKRGGDVEQIVLTAFLRHPICRKSLAALKPADFASYRDERLKTVKPGTMRRELAPLHNLFEVARHEWGLPITSNPLARVKVDALPNRRERRLQKGELDRLLKAAGDCQSDLVARIIVFAVETGMRRGEILAMRWQNLDLAEPSLLIPSTKNGHARTIPLTPRAVTVPRPHSGERVFPMSANAFRIAWGRVLDRAGLKEADLHFHDLRHEAISRLFELGLTVPEVALVSGHKDIRMLFRYTHPVRRDIADKLSINIYRR